MTALGIITGGLAMLVIGTRIKSHNTSACCQLVATGARDRASGYAGPAAGLVRAFLDATGLTDHLPSMLDALGVPKDA